MAASKELIARGVFLTRKGQIVLDPFAGSNVTGHVAQNLGRRWVSVEINSDYVAGSRLRFPDAVATTSRRGSAAG